AGPAEALAADADAVADRNAAILDQIKVVVRRIDDDRAGRLAATVVHGRAHERGIEIRHAYGRQRVGFSGPPSVERGEAARQRGIAVGGIGLGRPRGGRRRTLRLLGRVGIPALPVIRLVRRRRRVARLLVGRLIRPRVARIILIARIGLVARIALVARIPRIAGGVAGLRLWLHRLRVAGGAAAPIGIPVAILGRGARRERAGHDDAKR